RSWGLAAWYMILRWIRGVASRSWTGWTTSRPPWLSAKTSTTLKHGSEENPLGWAERGVWRQRYDQGHRDAPGACLQYGFACPGRPPQDQRRHAQPGA